MATNSVNTSISTLNPLFNHKEVEVEKVWDCYQSSKKKLFQQFYFKVMGNKLYKVGVKIGIQMITLRDKLLEIFLKQNRRKINVNEIYSVIDLMEHIMSDLSPLYGMDEIFKEVHQKVLQILISVRKGNFQQAVSDILEIIDSSQVEYGMNVGDIEEEEPDSMEFDEPELVEYEIINAINAIELIKKNYNIS